MPKTTDQSACAAFLTDNESSEIATLERQIKERQKKRLTIMRRAKMRYLRDKAKHECK